MTARFNLTTTTIRAPTLVRIVGYALKTGVTFGPTGRLRQYAPGCFSRGGLRVEISNAHQDFFVRGLVAIRAQIRGALAV